MSCRSLIEGITPEIHMLCFVLINNILSNLLCVWIFSQTVFIQWLQPTHRGVNQHSKDITQTQQQRPESPTVTLTCVCVCVTVQHLKTIAFSKLVELGTNKQQVHTHSDST